MQRFAVIRHPHNCVYLRGSEVGARRWTVDELLARRFPNEDAAIEEIVRNLDGKGHATTVICAKGL